MTFNLSARSRRHFLAEKVCFSPLCAAPAISGFNHCRSAALRAASPPLLRRLAMAAKKKAQSLAGLGGCWVEIIRSLSVTSEHLEFGFCVLTDRLAARAKRESGTICCGLPFIIGC